MKTSKERLALFLPGLYEGGAERIVLNLAKGISERGYAVDLVLARAEGPYMSQIPDAVRLVDLNAPRVLSSVPALAKYIQQERPTALLSGMFANVIALWARRLCSVPCRMAIIEHNSLSSIVNSKKDLRWQLYPKLAKWFYPWANNIIAVSNDVADDLARVTKIPRHFIQVIYNPIVTPDLQNKSEVPLEHPWFKEGAPPVILAVGRLTDQKAFDVLIRAFSLVIKKGPTHLLILGEGENRFALQSLINQLGLEQDVILLGFVQNPYQFMARASIFVLPSRWEGLPTVLVEALYLGLPIVATNCPGGTGEILKDGQFGRMVPVDDPLALAEAIQGTINVRRSTPASESWQPFHLDFVVDRYIKLLLGT
ncbi:MAG: glycosyltransferase [Anaerolineales bacterium]|nr:glycosyltransferase [Anaerolineales bacterium]